MSCRPPCRPPCPPPCRPPYPMTIIFRCMMLSILMFNVCKANTTNKWIVLFFEKWIENLLELKWPHCITSKFDLHDLDFENDTTSIGLVSESLEAMREGRSFLIIKWVRKVTLKSKMLHFNCADGWMVGWNAMSADGCRCMDGCIRWVGQMGGWWEGLDGEQIFAWIS